MNRRGFCIAGTPLQANVGVHPEEGVRLDAWRRAAQPSAKPLWRSKQYPGGYHSFDPTIRLSTDRIGWINHL